MPVTISLQPADPVLIRDLFGVESLALGETITLPGNAELTNLTAGALGMTAVDVARFLLENIDAVAANLLAAYLFEKLHNRRATLTIAEEVVPVDQATIASKLKSLQTVVTPEPKPDADGKNSSE